MLDQPFMDEVHRFTYKGMRKERHNKDHHLVLSRLRQSLRSAQRMVIDDDTVRLICRISHDREKFPLWAILARLPFDTLWIEFDLHEKVKEFERMGTLHSRVDLSIVSRPVGYLLQKDLDTSTRWIAHEFVDADGKNVQVTTQPCFFVFDPNGSDLQPVRGSTLWGKTTLSRDPDFPRLPLKGKCENGETIDCEADPEFSYAGAFTLEENSIHPDDWANDKIGACLCPVWTSVMPKKRLIRFAMEDALERAGTLRWLMILLATINSVPNNIRSMHGRKGHMQVPGAPPLSYFSHKVITLTVPKRNTIRYVSDALTREATGRHNKWHKVIGHWRHIEYGRKLPYFCKHEPSRVEGDIAWCERCERKLRWITLPNGRGSAALGYIDHSYLVTT